MQVALNTIGAAMYSVYIMASSGGVLYTGVTNNVETRSHAHKMGLGSAFTTRYKCHRLVYAEAHTNIEEAIVREKQIKGWTRAKKTALINGNNPGWQDLSREEDR